MLWCFLWKGSSYTKPARNRVSKLFSSTRQCKVLLIWLLAFSAWIFPGTLFAGQDALPKDLHSTLGECSLIVAEMQRQLADGGAIDTQIAKIGTQLENLQGFHLLLRERHRQFTERADKLGGKASQRQMAMADSYNQEMSRLLLLLEQLIQTPAQVPQLLPQIEPLLKQFLPSRPVPIHGLLPYQPLNYGPRVPVTAPTLVPAYQLVSVATVPADLAPTVEAPISKLITDQAQAIATAAGRRNWDPVDLYEWVKNNISTEWYAGCMKGAEETLRQRSGNDADQAALLIALLRASGYPARYVRGVVEFFPGIEAIKAQTGIDDAVAIGRFFRKAGIPCEPVMNGAEIVNYRTEHIWVEALIPYANYRGALVDTQGPVWLPLDTSFKVAGYDESGSVDLFSAAGNPLTTLRDAYLVNSRDLTPLELLRQEVTAFLATAVPGATYAEVLHTRALRNEVLRILPSAPQFTEIAITGEYTSLPTELIHTVRFLATSPASASLPIFDVTLPIHALSNRKIVIGFEPETVEDQEIVNIWGGLDNTPGYLVHLRPVLMVDNERIAVGREGIASGGSFGLTAELTSPAGAASFVNTLLAGYPAVIGLVAQDAVLPDPTVLRSEATDLLYREALTYIDHWNRGEKELAELLDLRTARPLPALVTLGGSVEVVELLGAPQGVTWKGLFLDADLRAVETEASTASSDNRQQQFLQLSALQGSVLEGRLFEDTYGVASISTAKLFGLAGDGAVGILTVDAVNAATLVPALPFTDNVKADITAAVAEGQVVKIPTQAISFQNWNGIGYIKEDPGTGAAGYMLSGQIAGGMTAVSPESWVYDLVYAFESPFAETPNLDPLAAYSIHKIGGTDLQVGAAGEELAEPLAVMVRDIEGRPVAGAEVTFTVERGGGDFASATTVTAVTNRKGIASTQPKLKLGSNIMADATTYFKEGDQYASFARENTVLAKLANDTALVQPFVAIAIPGAPTYMIPISNLVSRYILTYAGRIGIQLKDKYNNPVANAPVRFIAGTPTRDEDICSDADVSQSKLLAQLTTDEVCIKTVPSWGECASSSNVVDNTMSDGVISAGVVLGSLPQGQYPFTVNYAGSQSAIQPKVFVIGSVMSCGGGIPFNSIFLQHEDPQFLARPAGRSVTVRAKAEMIVEGETTSTETLSCLDDDNKPKSLDCSQVKGDGVFDIVTPNNLSLKFNGNDGSHSSMAPDMFEGNVTLAVGLNEVAVQASYEVKTNYYANSCDGCASTPTEKVSVSTDSSVFLYTGVAIDMPEFVSVILDSFGFPLADVPVNYTIRPLDYDAISASFLVYQGDNLVYVMAADTMGANIDIVPTYFHFNPASQYYVQVVLNYGWSEAEVWSEKVPIRSKQVDLDIDSDNNAGRNLDGTHRLPARDPQEEQAESATSSPGKVVLSNRLDVDHDKVPGFADGLDLFGNQGDGGSAPFVPMLIEVDGQLDPAQVRVRFAYEASNPVGITRTGDAQAGYVYTPAPGSLRLWTKDGGVSRRVASLAQGGDYIAPGISYTLAQLGTAVAPHVWRVYVEGIADTGMAQPIRLEVETVAGAVTTNAGADTVKVSVVNAALVPDYDHNRSIDQADIDRAERGDIYYFWINDDNDEGETGGDDIPLLPSLFSQRDCDNDAVDGMRDLIDFFPVTLDIAGLVRTFPPASYTYRLTSAGENLRVVFPGLTQENVDKYLIDVPTAARLGSSVSRPMRVSGIAPLSTEESNLPQSLFNSVVQSIANLEILPVVLLEGVNAGPAPLQLTVANTQGEEVARIDLNLSLDGVEQMYRRKNLIGELKAYYQSNFGQSGLPGHDPVPDINQPDRLSETQFENSKHFSGFDAENDHSNNFIHVHGYNVNDQASRGEQSEIFKRLYWSGSRAKFWGITWYGWESQGILPFTPNYHVNVRHAFNTGRLLKDFVAAQGLGSATIFGHSLGNMVVSSAIEEGMTVARYLMVNAAVAEEAYTPREVYGGNVYEAGSSWRMSTKEPMFHPAWRYPDEVEIAFEQTYQPRLWTSEWYKLFDANDGRSTLTWRNLFAKGLNHPDTYVYYATTDEAFRPFEYTVEMAANDPNGNGYQPNIDNWPGLEELFKNAISSTNTLGAYAWSSQELLKGRGGIPDSSAGGWGYNLQDGYQFLGTHVQPAVANSYPDTQLITKPFFQKNSDNDFLYNDPPVPVSAPLREELLANEIPVLTFAAGHRGVGLFNAKDKGVDIRQKYAVDKPWIADRPRFEWRHSDIYVVAYPFLSGLYDEWKSKIQGAIP